MRKRKRFLRTPEERAAQEANYQALLACIARAKAELSARGEPIRDLAYWIERGQAELAAKQQKPV